jgi:hypothetical protein
MVTETQAIAIFFICFVVGGVYRHNIDRLERKRKGE